MSAHRLMVSLLVVYACAFGARLLAQEEKPVYRIWQGVFTDAQATRGKHLYDHHCGSCHGGDLAGAEGPSLLGSSFVRSWGGRYLDHLYKKIQEQMPAEDASHVSDAEKVDIVAYMLKVNGFPAGSSELPLDLDAMAGIHVVGRDGPTPPPTGAMVAIVGCLARDGDEYQVTHSPEAFVSTFETEPPEIARATSAAAGSLSYGLLDLFPKPDSLVGHKILVKGLMIRQPDGDRVNVLTLQSLATTCGH